MRRQPRQMFRPVFLQRSQASTLARFAILSARSSPSRITYEILQQPPFRLVRVIARKESIAWVSFGPSWQHSGIAIC